MLELKNLTKSYSNERRVLDRLSWTFERGEFIAIMGDSGVGKSTLLNLIAGLDQPDPSDEPAIIVDGTPLASLDDDAATRLRRARMGFIFQAFHVLPHLNVRDNIGLPLLLQGRPDPARVDEMLAAVGLTDRARHLPRQLSGGQLQRVAIARALVHRPALVLADEPTGNLDPRHADQVMQLLRQQLQQQGAACLLVTHSAHAAALADRRLRLDGGQLVDA